MTEEDVQALKPIIENVGRLIDDATHLARSGSFPTAFVLNVIALEEIGKAVQLMWTQKGISTSSQKRSAHLQKQWAVACLLISSKLLPFYRKIISGEVSNHTGMIEIAEVFIDSKERRFFERVAAVELDRSKQVGLYEDKVTIAHHSRADIDAAFVLDLSETLTTAMPLLKNDLAVQVAAIFFELLPKFSEAILEDRNKH